MSRSKDDQRIRAEAWRQVVSFTSREDMARKLREHDWVVIPPAPLAGITGESIWVECESDSLIHVHIGRARYTLKMNEAIRLIRLLGERITE